MTAATLAGRRRVAEWHDPLPALARAAGMSGLAYLRAILEGELPGAPIAATLGFDPVEVSEGRVLFAAEPGEHHMNPIGLVHGGLAATLIDSATGCAIHTTLPAGQGYSTVDLSVSFVRPVLPGAGRILAEGVVTHRGGRIATAAGRVTSEETGKLLAHGTATCLLQDPPPGN